MHPLVRDNLWLFGEDWRLSRSEASLTTVLRDALHEDALLEADLVDGQVAAIERGNRRVDLVLQRSVLLGGRIAWSSSSSARASGWAARSCTTSSGTRAH